LEFNARLTSVAIRIPIRRHQNLIICSLAHRQPSLKISYKSVQKFLRKVANRQTDKQTNDDDYISFLSEVMMVIGSKKLTMLTCCQKGNPIYKNRVFAVSAENRPVEQKPRAEVVVVVV